MIIASVSLRIDAYDYYALHSCFYKINVRHREMYVINLNMYPSINSSDSWFLHLLNPSSSRKERIEVHLNTATGNGAKFIH